MKVFVSGSFDPLHSGHVAFLKTAALFGSLYVGIGSDESIRKYKHEPFFPEEERLYMIRAIRYVWKAWVNSGEGPFDFADDILPLEIDILVVNEDQHSEEKEKFCIKYGIRYVILKRIPEPGLPVRTSTEMRK